MHALQGNAPIAKATGPFIEQKVIPRLPEQQEQAGGRQRQTQHSARLGSHQQQFQGQQLVVQAPNRDGIAVCALSPE